MSPSISTLLNPTLFTLPPVSDSVGNLPEITPGSLLEPYKLPFVITAPVASKPWSLIFLPSNRGK